MNLVDRKQTFLEMNFFHGKVIEIPNPLKTDFDLADMFIENHNNRLMSSPFLHSWTNETEQKFSTTSGIWLYATADHLYLQFGVGSQEVTNEFMSSALFFVVPDNLQTGTKKIRLDIVCMN